jgi:hypothetical protein
VLPSSAAIPVPIASRAGGVVTVTVQFREFGRLNFMPEIVSDSLSS